MDEISTKAIIIGVSIFVTLLIVTVIIFEFEQIGNLYKHVAETDISFEDRLDEFDKYRDSNNEFNGLDVRNTLEKYKDDDTVDVCLKGSCNDFTINENNYGEKYYSTLETTNKGYKINFEQR